jgi:hypothetical protein
MPVAATDVGIGEFSATDGSYVASSRFGGSAPAGVGLVQGYLGRLDSAGVPLIYGFTKCDPGGSPACTMIDVGAGQVAPGGGSGFDGFVGRYSIATATNSWSTRLVGAGDDRLVSMAPGPGGTIYVAGWFDQDTALVSGSTMKTFTNAGDRDVLVAQFNTSNGQLGITKTFGGPSLEQAAAIAWTGSNIIVAGNFSGTTSFGSTTLTSQDFDIWVAELVPSDGSAVWAVPLGGPGRDTYPAITVDAAGDIYVAGTITGSATLGSYSVGGAGGADVFVAKLANSNGAVLWAYSFGSSGDDTAAGIAIGPTGNLLVSAFVTGPLQPGGTFFGMTDGVLASYAGDGTHLWTKVIGTSQIDYALSVTSAADAFYATLQLGGDIGATIEGVPIIGAPSPSGLLLKLQP